MKCSRCGTHMDGPVELPHGLPGTKYWECPSCGSTKPVTRRQGKERFRRNPPIVTFLANPPSANIRMKGNLVPYTGIRYIKNDPISRDVHAIMYTHAQNGEDFKHEFGENVKLYPAMTAAGKRIVIIEGDDDIWDDYPEDGDPQ